MKFSEKFGKMESNILLDLDEAKRKLEAQGREVINLSIGTPDFPPACYGRSFKGFSRP